MKKNLIILLIFVLIISTITLSACATQIELESGDYSPVYELEKPSLNIDESGKFKILQIGDTHLLGSDKKDKKTLDNLDNIFKQTKYDLVVMTGDIFEGYNNQSYNKPKAVEDIGKIFEINQQPFTFVSGNNDGEMLGSNENIILQFLKNPYFVFSDTKDIGGVGNSYIMLKDNSGVEKHRLVIMDTRMRDSKGIYNHIEQSQVDWYKQVAKECKEKNVLISFFAHIPFENMEKVIKDGESLPGDLNYNTIKVFYDTNTNNNGILYQAIKNSQQCGIIVNSHMHTIDIAKFYDGMVFKISKASGSSVKLGNGTKNGVTEITINTNSSSIKEMYEFNQINY